MYILSIQSLFLSSRLVYFTKQKGKIEVPPKSPEGGLFSNVCRKCLSPPSYIFLPGSRSGVFSVHYTPCLQTPEDRETGRKI